MHFNNELNSIVCHAENSQLTILNVYRRNLCNVSSMYDSNRGGYD